MASKTFKNLKQVEEYLQQQVNKVLETHVAPTVKDELESSAIEMLNEYDPSIYQRRSSSNSLGSGGIADKETMSAELVSDGVITITPNAERNKEFSNYPGFGYDTNKSLTENIVYGYGNRQYPWNQARDFVGDARENLRQNKNHIESMKDGLEEIFGVGNVF